jgi:glycosyltransferase involved in cell wall biosynthesis
VNVLPQEPERRESQPLRVSIICTVRNEAASIEPFVQSILEQTNPPDEMVIVDAGSTDGTVSKIEGMLVGRIPYRVIVRPGINIAAGRNVAVGAAKNDVLAVIDAGCRADPTWLEELMRPFREGWQVDFVGGVTLADPQTKFQECVGRLTTVPPEAYDEDGWLYSSRNAAFTKEIWAQVGGYPEWLYTAEDTLYDIELKRAGCRFGLARKARVRWRPRRTLGAVMRQWYLYGRGNGRIRFIFPGTGGKVARHLFALCVLVGLIITRNLYLWLGVLLLGILYGFLVTWQRTKDLKTNLLEMVILRSLNLAEVVGLVHGTLEWLLVPKYRYHLRRRSVAQEGEGLGGEH